MRTDVLAELKALRLYGMAQAWSELQAQGNHHGLQTEGLLMEHLLRTEHAEAHAIHRSPDEERTVSVAQGLVRI